MPTNIAMPVITKNEKVTKHIKFAADKTGVDFDYLLQTAKRESSLNINAKAKTSSATGLFNSSDKLGMKHYMILALNTAMPN